MDDLSQEWIDWLTAERDQAANTIASCARTLRSVGNAGTASRAEIEAWWETRRHLSRGTRAGDLSNLRRFYRWLDVWEKRADDPSRRLKAPKKERGLPRPMSRADLHKLLREFPPDLRRALALGAYGGLRVSETAALAWRDVDLETRQLRIEHAKGLKARFVKVSPILIDELLPNTGGNVVTGGGQPYSAASLQRRINRAIRANGVDATYHQTRHRFGVMAYQATGDLLGVGRALGHSSPVSTSIYATASDEVADRIAEAVVR